MKEIDSLREFWFTCSKEYLINPNKFKDLSEEDQSVLICYKNHLLRDTPPKKIAGLIILATKIISRHPGFGMDQVP
jgi:hypothetical protein